MTTEKMCDLEKRGRPPEVMISVDNALTACKASLTLKRLLWPISSLSLTLTCDPALLKPVNLRTVNA